jgi:hypothetical protein
MNRKLILEVTVVNGDEIATSLFEESDPIGKVSGCMDSFNVIGVLKKKVF